MTGLVWGPEGGSCGWIGGMCWRGHAQDGEREETQQVAAQEDSTLLPRAVWGALVSLTIGKVGLEL